ncbi:hypothetical protein L3Q82_014503 [Scortum barcoo]|uniref:Uncharacterized protein n=1 Tax=Scortum barcoo TaxID=214431 RepID=A0ACB8VXH8_9TELE|nr:hypothetical protein L3Q82_014503 [Scortum barcoo]
MILAAYIHIRNGAQKVKEKAASQEKDDRATWTSSSLARSATTRNPVMSKCEERTRNTGIISCSVCLEEFQTPITYLSEPVDVYSDWIDACEAANQ